MAAELANGPSGTERVANPPDAEVPDLFQPEPSSHPGPGHRARRIPWAALLQRVFKSAGQLRWPSACESKIHRDALRCPRCGSTMRLIAAIEDPMVARKILECLKLPARSPPLAPAEAGAPDWGSDDNDWFFDQSPAHDEAEALVSDS